MSKNFPSVMDVHSGKLPPCDSSNKKGENTWDLPRPLAGALRAVTVLRRTPEDVVGNHYHPDVPDKGPEFFFLVSGKVTFWFEDVHGHRRVIPLDAERDGTLWVEIPAYILHGLHVESESAVFLEQKTRPLDPNHTISAKEFEKFKNFR